MRKFPVVLLVSLAVALVASAAFAVTPVRPGPTERITLTPAATQANGRSQHPSVSADGRYVAFASRASNLVPETEGGPSRQHIYAHDRATGATELVSKNSDGEPGNLDSHGPTITPDGRYVVFTSSARSLTPHNAGNQNIYLRDRESGTTELVSVTLDGRYNFSSLDPAVSADGRYVVFRSTGNSHVDEPMSAGISRAYVRDRAEGTTELVPRTPDGTPVTASSFALAISAGGRHIAFRSSSDALAEGITNSVSDVFVYDQQTEVTERVSVASDGTEGNGHVVTAALSADGSVVAFISEADNLVPGDANNARDVFVRDRETGATELVSVTSTGRQHAGTLDGVLGISADGRLVTFSVGGLGGETAQQAYVHDRATKSTELVSVALDGQAGNDDSVEVATSADGQTVAFSSWADDLVPGDTNSTPDIFVRDRGPATGVAGLEATTVGDDVRVTGSLVLSGKLLAAVDAPGSDIRSDELARRHAGADLKALDVLWQAEADQVLVRWRVEDLRPVQPAAGSGTPGVLYGLRLEVDGDTFEVRARREPTGHTFGLYRCELVCELAASLNGGVGTTGPWVTAGVPLSALDAGAGDTLTQLLGYVAAGVATVQPSVELASVTLPDVTLPVVELAVAVGDADAAADELEFTSVAVQGHALDVTVPAPAGDNAVAWVRTCLDADCTLSSVTVAQP